MSHFLNDNMYPETSSLDIVSIHPPTARSPETALLSNPVAFQIGKAMFAGGRAILELGIEKNAAHRSHSAGIRAPVDCESLIARMVILPAEISFYKY